MSQASEEDAILLAHYVSLLPDGATVVEIGTHRGASAIVLAESLPASGHIYTIDHGGAVKFGIGELSRVSPDEATKKARSLALFRSEYERQLCDTFLAVGCEERITFLFGSSHHEEWMDAVAWSHGDIDLLFIDGDHCYPGVMADLIRWAPMVKRHGYMLLHDYVGDFKSVPAATSDYFDAHPGEWKHLEQSGLTAACQRVGGHRRR